MHCGWLVIEQARHSPLLIKAYLRHALFTKKAVSSLLIFSFSKLLSPLLKNVCLQYVAHNDLPQFHGMKSIAK
jgi:hypothetical protein